MMRTMFAAAALAAACAGCFHSDRMSDQKAGDSAVNAASIAEAGRLIGLSFSKEKIDSMVDGMKDQLSNYNAIRSVKIDNSVPPALMFHPAPVQAGLPTRKAPFRESDPGPVELPKRMDDLAFYSIGQLSALIKSRRLSSVDLTKMYLARLKKYGPKLNCVVTLTEELALAQAQHADEEIALGKYRGPLHGIPYGIKDLFDTRNAPTTWGAAPYKDRFVPYDATVVTRLQNAGAVLAAKLSMGELAWGDVWFGGKTRNPWNPEEGSSGSSAGSAAATAAGLVGFSIGTETWGSIVSPSTVCGTTGLRPTYGRVARTGAMALSWSMDKVGPICRTVEDCAIVFNAICGPDGLDETVQDIPFNYDPGIDLTGWNIGYVKAAFDSVRENRVLFDSAFAVLRRIGVNLIPVRLPEYPMNDLAIILAAEAGAAFDDLTRSGRDDLLVRQIKDAWPNVLRLSRFIPAVEYIQANRIRYRLIQDMGALMGSVEMYIAPPFQGDNLLLTNLTGHPCVVLPVGFTQKGMPASITFIGRLYEEGFLLAFAKKYQDMTGFHLRHPQLAE